MIAIKDIDVELSLKLGDPVLDNGDGEIWDKVDRLRYISRAYGKICRVMNKIMDDRQPLWSKKNQYMEVDLSTATGKDIDLGVGFSKIIGFYVSVKSGGTPIKVTHIESDRYLDASVGTDTTYTPDYTNNKFLFTILNGKIQLLPTQDTGKYYKGYITYKGEPETFGIDDSMDITTDYLDILTTLAAMEGMQDLARADKVGIYRTEFADQLKILDVFIQKEERDEGVHS